MKILPIEIIRKLNENLKFFLFFSVIKMIHESKKLMKKNEKNKRIKKILHIIIEPK